MTEQRFRTDRNNNPTAFTTNIAKDAELILGTNYYQGDSFEVGKEAFYTAHLIGDPIALTIRVIDKIGFFNKEFHPRWIYIQLEYALWKILSFEEKKFIISLMYKAEGGTEMKGLFE